MSENVLRSRLDEAMKDAMRARAKERLGTIRLILAAVKQVEVDTREDVDEDAILDILARMAKQRRESIDQYEKADRQDLADKEKAEIVIIQEFLPEQLGEDELRAMVVAAVAESGAASMREMGKVMKIVKPQCQGRADLGAVSAMVKDALAGG